MGDPNASGIPKNGCVQNHVTTPRGWFLQDQQGFRLRSVEFAGKMGCIGYLYVHAYMYNYSSIVTSSSAVADSTFAESHAGA